VQSIRAERHQISGDSDGGEPICGWGKGKWLTWLVASWMVRTGPCSSSWMERTEETSGAGVPDGGRDGSRRRELRERSAARVVCIDS
jgi:hypothetical protein